MSHDPQRGIVPIKGGEDEQRRVLTALELQVVTLSLADDRRSIGDHHGLAGFLRYLFGRSVSNRLANPRLEALRVFCVRYRYDPRVLGGAIREGDPVEQHLDVETMMAACRIIDRATGRSPAVVLSSSDLADLTTGRTIVTRSTHLPSVDAA